MKLYEKILIGLLLFFFSMSIFDEERGGSDWYVFFALTALLLAVSYLFTGYFLFNSKEKKRYFIPIVAGIAFGTSLYTLPFLIRFNYKDTFDILPFINVGFFLGLLLYLIIGKIAKYNFNFPTGIFVRSGVIVFIVGFFWYGTVLFYPYRQIMLRLNVDNFSRVSQMRMFNKAEKAEKALDKDDCDDAIKYFEQAAVEGMNWLSIPTSALDSLKLIRDIVKLLNTDSMLVSPSNEIPLDSAQLSSEIENLSGIFDALYRAYNCKAVKYNKQEDYQSALQFYQKANNALKVCVHNMEYVNLQQSYHLNDMALCYKNLKMYESADSIYRVAIEKYYSVLDTTNRNIAIIYNNYADLLSEVHQYEYANALYRSADEMLSKGLQDEMNQKEIYNSYLGLIENYIKTDSLQKAVNYIQKVIEARSPSRVLCKTKLFHGIYFLKLSEFDKAHEILSDCLDCLRQIYEPTYLNIAETHLAITYCKIAQAKYEQANTHLNQGMDIVENSLGTESLKFSDFLQQKASLNRLHGNYRSAENQYQSVIKICQNYAVAENSRLPEALLNMAELQVTLTEDQKAKYYLESARTILNNYQDLQRPAFTKMINSMAYVYYSTGSYDMADSLYRNTLQINENFGRQKTIFTASALNGLGLVMTAKGEKKEADSLFIHSLKLHKEIFTENHPFTAVVYLNYARLKIEENKLKQAKSMLIKSLDINKIFFDKGHDIFADIYVAYGDIAKRERHHDRARNYYQKALDIYLDIFGEEHLRVIATRERLKGRYVAKKG